MSTTNERLSQSCPQHLAAERRRASLLWWMLGNDMQGPWTARELAEGTGLYAGWSSDWDRRDRCTKDLHALEREGLVARDTSASPLTWGAVEERRSATG